MKGDTSSAVEGVIVISREGEPYAVVRKNGKPQWFLLKEMVWSDVEEFLDANQVQ